MRSSRNRVLVEVSCKTQAQVRSELACTLTSASFIQFIVQICRQSLWATLLLGSRYDDDLRRRRGLLLHDDDLFRAEAAAPAAKGKQGDDGGEAGDASDDNTSDGATIRLAAIGVAFTNAERVRTASVSKGRLKKCDIATCITSIRKHGSRQIVSVAPVRLILDGQTTARSNIRTGCPRKLRNARGTSEKFSRTRLGSRLVLREKLDEISQFRVCFN